MTRSTTALAAVIAVAILALAWMFLIQPQNEEIAAIEADIVARQDESRVLDTQIAGLQDVRARAPDIESSIAEVEGVIPSDPALPAALRQFQAAADDAGVSLLTLAPARPTAAEDADTPNLYQIPVAMTIRGSYFQTVDFLRRLEDPAITARGVEVQAVTINRNDDAYPALDVAITASMYAVLDDVPVPVEEAPVTTAPETTTEAGDDAGEGEA